VIGGFDDGRARAVAVCATRLAILYLTVGHWLRSVAGETEATLSPGT